MACNPHALAGGGYDDNNDRAEDDRVSQTSMQASASLILALDWISTCPDGI
jgi:hypothetical protein